MILTRRNLVLGGLGIALAGSSTAGYAAAIEPFDILVTSYRPTPTGWPADRHLTIAVVADLHAGGPNMGLAQIERVVARTQSLGADLVVLLGDYFATHRFITEQVSHAAWAAALGRLSAPLGVHAILGNHDWWFDIAGTRAALARVGIPVLENNAVLMGPPGKRFWLAGIGDQLAYKLPGHGRFRGVDDLPGTLAQVTTEDPVILLVHEPDIFTRVPERVALTLAGHTHGGQVRLPLLWQSYVPSRYGARYAYGHVVEGGRHMIVSGGLGTSFVPARLGVPPEVLHIELGMPRAAIRA